MNEFAKSSEEEIEPLLSELLTELDNADLSVLKRYGWFINIPTEHNFVRILHDTGHLYHAFGQYLRKMNYGDIDLDTHKVSITATVIKDIAQKHYHILSDYETDRVKIALPDWDEIQQDLTTDFTEALKISPHEFTDTALDRLEALVEGEKSVLIMLSRGLREKRIDMGRQALQSAKGVLKVSAGTVIGMAAWQRISKKD